MRVRISNDLAVAACKQALALVSVLGSLYSDMKQYDHAVAAHREAIRLKPDDAVAYYNLGLTYLAAGRKDQALQAYRTLQRLDRKKAQELSH